MESSSSSFSDAATLVGQVRGVKLFSDGKVERTSKPLWPDMPADDKTFPGGVGCKDVIINRQTGLNVRIFLPKSAVEAAAAAEAGAGAAEAAEQKKLLPKLPVLVYFHGGGFVAFHPCSSIFHNLCSSISPKLGLLVVSVDYRLAPEHRLPVAFHDSFEALCWIQQQAKLHAKQQLEDEELLLLEPWMKLADVSNCLLMGGSAGGTICHLMAVKTNEYDFYPLRIKGIIPVVPFFGAEARSESEIRSLSMPDVLTLEDCDLFWLFSLPEGANRDHPYCRCPQAEQLTGLTMPPCLVVVGAKDVLHSRQIEYVEVMKQARKDVQLLEYTNRGHMLLFPEVEDDMQHSYQEMLQFMDKCFQS